MAEYNSTTVIYGRSFLNTILAAFKTLPAAALIIAAAKIRLSKDPAFAPTADSTIAGLAAQEATFTGYPAGGIAVVQSAPVNLSPGAQGELATALFTATGSAIGNVVTGYWIDDGTNVVLAERFAGGLNVSFAVANDFLELVVQLPLQTVQKTV